MLVTSLGKTRGIDDPERARLEDKCVTLAPGEKLCLCDLPGPGRIVRIWFTVPLLGRPLLRDVVIRMYWDDEAEPSVACPLGDLFGAAFARPHRIVSDRLVIAGGGYLCRFEMPFARRAVVEIENQSLRPVRFFFFQIGYYRDEEPQPDLETFHAQWRRDNPTVQGRPCTVLEAKGRGRFVGLKVDIQNRSLWLKPPFAHIVIPRGLGIGTLEGWETMRVDGEARPSIVGTGGEDYFSGGFYFSGGAFCTPTHGAIVRSYLTGRVSAYRFHVDDPIPFAESLEVTMDHGFANTMEADYCSVAYWYQKEPHAPFPPLPPPSARRPLSPWINVAQILLGAGLVTAALAALIASVRSALHLLTGP